MNAKDMMNKDVMTLSEEATVRQMFYMMEKYSIESFAVLDSYNELCGMVSGKEMLNAVYSRLEKSGGAGPSQAEVDQVLTEVMDKPVREIMTKDVSGAFGWTSEREAGHEMFMNHLDKMPVVEEGKIIGVITPASIFLSLLREKFTKKPFEQVQAAAFEAAGFAESKGRHSETAIWRRKGRGTTGGATKRAYKRAEARFKVAYRPAGGDETAGRAEGGVLAYSKNISAGGLMLETETRLTPGILLYVKFKLDQDGAPIESLSSVCWVKDGPSAHVYYAGIAFMALTTHDRTRIDRYVGSLMANF